MNTLTALLRPQGIKTVTTGSDEIGRFLLQRYGTTDLAQVEPVWQQELDKIATAKVVMLGVPSDVGAGFERGAFKGPLGIRLQFLSVPGMYQALAERGVIDIGDVFVNPSLLHDDLLHPDLIAHIQRERWGKDGPAQGLPVSPLSALKRSLQAIHEINPQARVLLLGGDHSISWIPIECLTPEDSHAPEDLGIVHFDAHTDLLRERDGVKYSFATWAYHANDRIGRGGRLQQIGIRVSGKSREHWESTLELRQFRMEDVRALGTEGLIQEVIANLQRAGVRRVYISNDIDGTDPRWAAATGTMEPEGLHPKLVRGVIQALGNVFEIVGSDLVEVAPPLNGHLLGEPGRTLQTGACYVWAQLDAMLGNKLDLANPFSIPEPVEGDLIRRRPTYASSGAGPLRPKLASVTDGDRPFIHPLNRSVIPVRQTIQQDIPGLRAVADSQRYQTTNFSNHRLGQKVGRSTRSFRQQTVRADRQEFMFTILSGLGPGAIPIGTSSFYPKHGTPERPHNYYRQIGYQKLTGPTGQLTPDPQLLFGQDFDGPAEVGAFMVHRAVAGRKDQESLVEVMIAGSSHTFPLQPGYARAGSHARFFWAALSPHREDLAERTCLSEFLPHFDETGPGTRTNAFYEQVVRRYLDGQTYAEMDALTAHDHHLLAKKLPPFLRINAMPEAAQPLIGKAGKATQRAVTLLTEIGFAPNGDIDPLDGGPHYEGAFADNPVFTGTQKMPFGGAVGGTASLERTNGWQYGFIGRTWDEGSVRFRAVVGPYQIRNGTVVTTDEVSHSMGVAAGEWIGVSSLDFVFPTEPPRGDPEDF